MRQRLKQVQQLENKPRSSLQFTSSDARENVNTSL